MPPSSSSHLNPKAASTTDEEQHQKADLCDSIKNINMHGEELTELYDPSEEELEDWKCTLFVKIYNTAFLQIKAIEAELKKVWHVKHDITLKPVGSGLFMFKIKDEILREFIACNSPWLIKGSCMAFQTWKEGIVAHKIDFLSIDFWFQIYNLPLELITPRNGWVLGRKIGTPLDVDKEIHFNDLGAFQRVKVKIDTRLPLPCSVEISTKTGAQEILPVKIENLGVFCFACGKLGHEKARCMLGTFYISRSTAGNKNRRYSLALKGQTLMNRSLKLPVILDLKESQDDVVNTKGNENEVEDMEQQQDKTQGSSKQGENTSNDNMRLHEDIKGKKQLDDLEMRYEKVNIPSSFSFFSHSQSPPCQKNFEFRSKEEVPPGFQPHHFKPNFFFNLNNPLYQNIKVSPPSVLQSTYIPSPDKPKKPSFMLCVPDFEESVGSASKLADKVLQFSEKAALLEANVTAGSGSVLPTNDFSLAGVEEQTETSALESVEVEDAINVEEYTQMWEDSKKRVRIAVIGVEPIALTNVRSPKKKQKLFQKKIVELSEEAAVKESKFFDCRDFLIEGVPLAAGDLNRMKDGAQALKEIP